MLHVAIGPDRTPASLRLVEGPVPAPGPHDLLIDVAYAGVNRPDCSQRAGSYPPPPGASPIMGLEVSGHVAAFGEEVSGWQLGQPVCALVNGGGYAEQCIVPATQALPVPEGVSLEHAAGIPENWFTVWANLTLQGRLVRGERLLVHGGASGIGLAALQLARLRHAQAYATVGDAGKAALAREFGAAAAIDYRTEDFAARIVELTHGQGVDVILDMVAGSYINREVPLLRRDGRLVFIAFQQGARADFDFGLVLRNRLVITGSTIRPRTAAEKRQIRDGLLNEVWPAFARGELRVHVHAVLPLREAGEAHRLMESGAHSGKIILAVRPA
jgi:putative PIG3 family NAD(P)H quinone oxidoreductase